MTVASVGLRYNLYYNSPTGPFNAGSAAVGDYSASLGTIAATDTILMSLCFSFNDGADPGTVTVAGFITIAEIWHTSDSQKFWVGYRQNPTAGEAVSYAVSWPSGVCRGCSVTIERFTGVVGPPTGAVQRNGTASTSTVAPGITPSGTSGLLRNFFTWYSKPGTGTYGDPPTSTRVLLIGSTGSTCPEILVEGETYSSSAAIGTRTATGPAADTTLTGTVELPGALSGGGGTPSRASSMMMMGV